MMKTETEIKTLVYLQIQQHNFFFFVLRVEKKGSLIQFLWKTRRYEHEMIELSLQFQC